MSWHLSSSGRRARACVSAPELQQRLKTNLFVEAEKLTVSYPTVQRAVDMDVVGLQMKVKINTAALPVSQYKHSKATALVPEHGFYDFYVSLLALSVKKECAAWVPMQLSFPQKVEFSIISLSLPLRGGITPHFCAEGAAGWMVSAKHTPTDVSEE